MATKIADFLEALTQDETTACIGEALALLPNDVALDVVLEWAKENDLLLDLADKAETEAEGPEVPVDPDEEEG